MGVGGAVLQEPYQATNPPRRNTTPPGPGGVWKSQTHSDAHTDTDTDTDTDTGTGTGTDTDTDTGTGAGADTGADPVIRRR